MFRKMIFFLFLVMLPFTASAKVKVVASLPVFGALAQEVGGERVEVTNLAKPGQDPHFLDAKPSYVVSLSRADLLLHGGLELEVGWLPPVVTQSRNPKIQANAIGDVNLARGLSLLEVPSNLDRSQGDVHPLGNPHTWLDPRNARIMAGTIAESFIRTDPEGKSDYQKRLASFESRLDQKMKAWQEATNKIKNLPIVSYHRSFSYLAHWLGFTVLATIEPKPGIPPSSQTVNALLDQISHLGVKGILVENFYPLKIPEYLHEKSGVPYKVLPTDVGEEGVTTYFELIDRLVNALLSFVP